MCLAFFSLLTGTAVQADVLPPAASKCVFCHGNPFGTTQTVNNFWDRPESTIDTNEFRKFLLLRGSTMSFYGSADYISDLDLATVLPHFMEIRNARVQLNNEVPPTPPTVPSLEHSYTFTTSLNAGQTNASSENLNIKITNLRRFALTVTKSGGETIFPSTTSCTSSVAAATRVSDTELTTHSCEINVTFQAPTTVGSVEETLNIDLHFAGGLPGDVRHKIKLTGTSSGPAPSPAFSHSDLEVLTTFSASLTGSQTLCPTFTNSRTGSLTLEFSAVRNPDSSADFSNYFELGDGTVCPAIPLCTTLPPGSVVAGSTSLSADSTCALPLRFNPGKFGASATTGARSATLRIMHNVPQGSVADFLLNGEVTVDRQPRIGLFTDPDTTANGRVSPPAFATQTVNVASTVWNEFLVFNIGDANGLDLTSVTQTNTAEFALTENCVAAAPLSIANRNDPHCTISLRFTPSAIGERCTTVTVRAAVGGSSAVTVCGTGVPVRAAALTLSADSIDFGRRFLSAAYPPKPLVISNAIGATDLLQINAITLVGSGFALVPDSGTSRTSCVGSTLQPGASCTLQVQFAPDPARPETPYSASLQIDTNDATPRRTVALAAVAGTVATPPVLQVPNTPAQIEFADFVVAGQQSTQPLSVTLRNAGPGVAAIEAIRMVGADASSFSASNCPATLQETETCTIILRFAPGSGGLKRAQLEVLSSSSVTPALVSVIGRGVGGTSAFLTASSATLSLGGVRVGARSEPVEVRLASAGDGVVRITGMEADGPFTVQSKSCPGVPFTLPRGGDCTVTVTFTPTDARAATASLRISTDADTLPLVIPLAGSGEAKANVSSGGCSLVSGDAPFDPTLWALVLLAAGAIVYRNRARAARRRQP
jgi:hypothetical protein